MNHNYEWFFDSIFFSLLLIHFFTFIPFLLPQFILFGDKFSYFLLICSQMLLDWNWWAEGKKGEASFFLSGSFFRVKIFTLSNCIKRNLMFNPLLTVNPTQTQTPLFMDFYHKEVFLFSIPLLRRWNKVVSLPFLCFLSWVKEWRRGNRRKIEMKNRSTRAKVHTQKREKESRVCVFDQLFFVARRGEGKPWRLKDGYSTLFSFFFLSSSFSFFSSLYPQNVR